MTSKIYDAVIIGAGIVGAACAAESAREGLSVAIVEAGIVGGGATAAGMGHLVVMDDSEAQFALTRYSERGVAVEILDAQSVAEAEPNLRPGLVGGLRVPGDSVIYPPCAAQFFVNQAVVKGAALFLGKT